MQSATFNGSRKKSIVSVGGIEIGGDTLTIMAGPCAVESNEQTLRIAAAVFESGAQFFRGGAYKPRTSPYAFQGLEEEGLIILAEVRERFGLKIVTEAIDEKSLELVEQYADVIQIGTRNMENGALLRRAGRSCLPVLLKRGMSASVEEWLQAAECITSQGNPNVILCERGIRTFTQHSRNTLDLAVVPALQKSEIDFPVIVDPSHGTGKRFMVHPMARAGVAVGADGIIVDIHDRPEQALCDGEQALDFAEYNLMLKEVRAIHQVLNPVLAAA